MNSRFMKFFLVLFVATIFVGCGKKKTEVSDDTQFMEYISSYPQSRISLHAAIRVVLSHPSDKAKPGQREEETFFTMDPKVEGSTFWVDNRTIEFQPATALERGKEYQVTFELGKLVDLDGRDDLKQFVFPVEVIRQNIYVIQSSISHDVLCI